MSSPNISTAPNSDIKNEMIINDHVQVRDFNDNGLAFCNENSMEPCQFDSEDNNFNFCQPQNE